MVDYYNVTTNTGDAEIAAAIASNTKLAITHIAFGDGNGAVPTPLKTRTTLVREVHRQAVTKYERHSTNANWIVIETIIPSNIGGFWVREMGVIANGKMISHGSHAPFEKVVDPTGVSEYRLKFTLNVKDGNVVNITLDQSLIYASQAWTDENYVPRDEIIDNLTTDDALKPVSAKQAKKLQDNKLDKTANAASATKLATARSIGGVNFDGTANINLPGVNTAGNQSTSGNAASATKLQTARTIAILGAVTGTATSFDGSANVAITTTSLDATKLSGTVPAAILPAASTSAAGAVKLNDTLISTSTTEALTAAQGKVLQDNKLGKTENAATATKLATARTIAISGAVTGTATSFDGSANVAITTTSLDATKLSGTVPAARLPAASTSAAGAVKLNDTLISTSTTEALTAAQAKVLNDQAFGVNQTYIDVTASRVSGTTYTNTTSKTITVYVEILSSDGAELNTIEVSGNVLSSGDWGLAGMCTALSFPVPIGATYKITTSNQHSIIKKWSELR